MRPLRAVEGDHGVGAGWGGGLDLLVRRIFIGVRDFGALAVAADEGGVPGADEKGGDGGDEDEAVRRELAGLRGWDWGCC